MLPGESHLKAEAEFTSMEFITILGGVVECSSRVNFLNHIFFICQLNYFPYFYNYSSPKLPEKSKYVLCFLL